jgi:hypothetical protein
MVLAPVEKLMGLGFMIDGPAFDDHIPTYQGMQPGG